MRRYPMGLVGEDGGVAMEEERKGCEEDSCQEVGTVWCLSAWVWDGPSPH